jgi:thioredoxin-like negative regulator of GroEL
MIIKRILLCLALLAPSALALADSPAATAPAKRDATTFSESQINEITSMAVLQRMVAGYEKLKDDQRLAWTLKRASELNPNSGDMRLALALTYARMGKKSETYDLLLKMKEQGYGIDLSDDARFEKVTGTRHGDTSSKA